MTLLVLMFVFFFFKQKTAYEMRISDWSSDVCSSDLSGPVPPRKSLFRDFPNSLSAALSGAIEIDRRTDERFQRLLVDRVAFMDIDRAADVAVEARKIGRAHV